MGQGKKFKPTAEQRRQVKAMAALGQSHDSIISVLFEEGMKRETLAKHFRKELTNGKAEANMKVAKCAFDMAISGQWPAMTCFWMKTQAGWREKPQGIDDDKPLPWED